MDKRAVNNCVVSTTLVVAVQCIIAQTKLLTAGAEREHFWDNAAKRTKLPSYDE